MSEQMRTSEEILAAFGLDMALTESDDGDLWAAVLAAHAPDPREPTLNVEGLSFEIGGIKTVRSYSPEDPPTGERWVFERRDSDTLRAVRSESPLAASRQGFPPQPPRPPQLPYLEIGVNRPTRDTEEAVVYTALHSGPLAGRAEARLWARDPAGERRPAGWTPTERVIFSFVR